MVHMRDAGTHTDVHAESGFTAGTGFLIIDET